MRQRQGVVIIKFLWWVVYSADLVRMNPIALPIGQAFLAVTSPSCGSFPFSSCYMVWWCGTHFTMWQMLFSITFFMLRICTSAEAILKPCRHGMFVPQATDQHMENPPEKSVWGWQANSSPLGPGEGGDGVLPRSTVAGGQQGKVSAFPQVILLADFTLFCQAGILAKLGRSLPWCEVPITSFSRQLVCKCS